MTRTVRTGRWVAIAMMASCQSPPPPVVWHGEDGYRWRELTVVSDRPNGFTELPSSKTRITFRNDLSDSAAMANRIFAHGAGVALGDVDGDGATDIFFARTLGPNQLYRNLGDWRFEEIAASAGVAESSLAGTAAALVDIDGDDDLDLVLGHLGGPNRLYLNDGKAHFTADQKFPGNGSTYGSVGATLADIDGDGDLDLYFANLKPYTAIDRYSPEEMASANVVRRTADGGYEIAERFRKDFRLSLNLNGPPGRVEIGEPDQLYLNEGAGVFVPEPMAKSPRFHTSKGEPLANELPDFTLAARFYDLNGDRAPDLVTANDFEDPDQLWINDGHGNFTNVAPQAIRTTSRSSMSVDFADVDRDGLVDIFESDMLSRDTKRLRTEATNPIRRYPRLGDFDHRIQVGRNTLLLNRGDGTFAEIAELAGIDASGWSWGTVFLDVDLDGFEDLLVATGNRWELTDVDAQLGGAIEPREFNKFPRLKIRNYAFRNRGDLTFEEVDDQWRFGTEPDISMAMATGDLDGDGDQDAVVSRLDQPALVLRNDAGAPRVAVQLAGTGGNTRGIGAKVRLFGGAVPCQEREITAGGLYMSHADYLLTFAAGTADSLRLEVIWRDGSRSIVRDVKPNRLYQIDQAGATRPESPADSTRALFEDQSAGLPHTHLEPPFPEEIVRQPLLPNNLAELGPGISWVDFDHDGDDDLVITTGRNGELNWYRNVNGRFSPVRLTIASRGDFTTALPIPTAQGGLDLLVGQSNYESLEDDLGIAGVLRLSLDPAGRLRGSPSVVVSGDTATVGPLALADVDRDGTLDLFVGARVDPGQYPRASSSKLLLGTPGGALVFDSSNAALLGTLGMVSSAVFSDVDGDDDPDLLLAIEWGPITLLLNDRGTFRRAPDSWGLDRLPARWLGIATGDFDSDGRPDLITTSLGRNVRHAPDSANPQVLFFGHFDQDNVTDLLLTQYDQRIKGLAPLTGTERLRAALADARRRFPSFQDFAEATAEEIIGPGASSMPRVEAKTSAHLVWINRGDHFEPHPLPLQAQLAPAFAPVVADFDGDGREDLVLAENLSNTRGEDPPYDAGRGLLLLGDGLGHFEPISGTRSGIIVYGDQRGAATADYDRDARADLAITQGGAATRLFHNVAGTPGLRIRLLGSFPNPAAIGATLRLQCGDRLGPAREIQAGSGYWSMNSSVSVLGRTGPGPCTVQVRWPNGKHAAVAESPGSNEVVVKENGG